MTTLNVSLSGKKKPTVQSHDTRVAFRNLLPTALIFLILYIVAMAVSTAAIPDISIFSLDYTHDQLKFRFWADALTYPVVIGTVVFGAACAFASFRFLLIKTQSTSYLSLPITRAKMYITRVVASAIVMVGVLLIALLVTLVLNIIALGTWEGEFVQFLYIFFGLVVCAFVGYSISLLAVLLAGTQLEAVLLSIGLLVLVSVVCWGLNVVMDWLLVGNAAGEYLINTQTQVAPSLLESLASCNPLLFFVDAAAAHQTFMVIHPVYAPVSPDWFLPIVWLVFSIVLSIVCNWLFVGRRGERAGMAGLCMPLTFVFSFVLALAIFAIVFFLLASLNVPSAIIAGIVCFVLVSFLMLAGPLKGENAPRKRIVQVLGSEVIVLAVIMACIGFGGLGYASKVPNQEDVSSVEMSYVGSPVYLATKFDSASASANSYYVSGSYSYTNAEDIALISNVHSQLISTGHATCKTDTVEFGKTVVPYDIVLTYTLKDGSTITRYYDRARMDELYQLLALDDSSALATLRSVVVGGNVDGLDATAASTIAGSMTGQAFSSGNIYLSDALYTDPLLLNCTDTARKELLDALAKDISKQSSKDRYEPDANCLGVLMFSSDGENDSASFSYQMENSIVYITSSFKNTLAWLKDKGLSKGLGIDVSQIASLSFEKYDPYQGMNDASTSPHGQIFFGYHSDNSDNFISAPDFGVRFETKEKKQIKELVPLMRNTYFLGAGGYQVCATLKNGSSTYLFIPQSIAPDWLIQQVG